MTDSVWISDQYGAKAYVPSSAVDRWKPHGWAEADDPANGDFVWMQHEEHKGRAKFPAAAVESWQLLGWSPSDPPEPHDVTKDRQFVDVPAKPAAPAAQTKPTTRTQEK